MIIYVFDGTFEGFLTSVYESYYTPKKPNKIISGNEVNAQFNMIDEFIYIDSNLDKSNKVYNSLETKFSKDSFMRIYYSFLSDIPGTYTKIYEFIVLGFKLGKNLDMHLHNPIVSDIEKISRKVTLEAHRFLGFVRFKEIGENTYYSSIEPDHNILYIIYNHFTLRYKNQNFIIHDVKRNIGLFYDTNNWIIKNFKEDPCLNISASKEEDIYNILWKQYFLSASIEERKSLRRQKQMMPIRYWNHLNEVK